MVGESNAANGSKELIAVVLGVGYTFGKVSNPPVAIPPDPLRRGCCWRGAFIEGMAGDCPDTGAAICIAEVPVIVAVAGRNST